jgi:hypothetical protein
VLRRITLLGVFSIALVAGAERPASAVGVVLGAEATNVRVAIAPAPDRTTRWISLGVSGTQPFVWIVPMGREAAVDTTSSAWLEALDVVSAPRVVSSCGGSAMETVRGIDLGAGLPAPKLTIAATKPELDAALTGFFVTPEMQATLKAILETHDLAVLRAVAPTPATIRIVDRDAYPMLSFSLLQSPRDVDVVTMVVGGQRATMGTSVEPPQMLHWFGTQSDYLLQRDGILAKAGPGAFLTESALPAVVLDNQRVSPAVVNSLALEYFSRAADYGDTTGSLVSCVGSAGSQGTTVQTPYCARGDLGGTTVTPCTSASGLTCGPHADDLALAMAGRAPKYVWITRLVGRVSPLVAAPDALVSSPGGAPVNVLHVAGATCKSSGGAGWGGSGGGGGKVSPGNSGGCSGSVEDTSSGSGDVSSSSSDDSCSGDSTDTSSSGDDCGSSSSGGDSCDSGGGGGGDCGGGGGGGDCADATPRKNKTAGKSPLSRVTLSAALILLPLRRLTRKKTKTST